MRAARKKEGDSPLDDKPMPFLAHLEELRWCLIRSFLVALAGFGISLFGVRQLLELLEQPLKKAGLNFSDAPTQLRTLSVVESFTALFTLALVAGLAVSLPYFLYEIWRFVSPGLTPKERKAIGPLLFWGTIFFFAGVTFTHTVVLPPAIEYFLKLNKDFGLAAEWRILDYMKFTLTMLFVSGLMAELPILTVVLARFGLVSAPFLIHYWRHAVVLLFLAAAVLTPSTDAFTMLLLAGPLLGLYALSIGLAKIFYVPSETLPARQKTAPATLAILALFILPAPQTACAANFEEDPVQLNNLGVQATKVGNFKEAIRFFHQALDITPDDTDLLQNLSIAMNNQALQYLSDTRPELAITWLMRALQVFPDPHIQKNLAQAMMMQGHQEAAQGRPELARQLFLDAAATDPESAEAHEWLGRSLYDAGQLGEALKHIEESMRLGSSKDLRTFADKVRREMEGEKNFFEHRGLHFRIFYSAEIRSQDISLAARELEQSYQDHRMFLGEAPKREIQAVFYSSKQGFTGTHDLTSNVAGIYDGKVRLPIPDNLNWESVRRTLAHEVAHAFLFDLGGADIPLWLNEGMAELLSAGLERPTPSLDRVIETGGKPLRLNELSQTLKNLKNNTQVSLAYDQSYSVVKFVHGRHGVFGLRRLLKAFKEGKTEDEAIQKNFFMTPEILQQSWESRLLR